MHRIRHIPRWLISLVFFSLIAVFLALYLQSIDFSKLRNLPFNWSLFTLSFAVGLLFLFLGAYIWRVILRALGASDLPNYRTTTKVYARAWMGRYIPGTVTWIAGKVYLASGWGISKSRLSVASLLEGGSQVLGTVFVAFILLGFDSRLDVLPTSAKLALIGLGVMVLVVLIPVVFNKILAIAFKVIGRRTASDDLRINGQAVTRSFGLYVIGGIIQGCASFLVIKSIAPELSYGDLGYIIGIIGLSTVAGMAAPFAPSGIGIKDGLLLILLTAILPNETALAATVIIRLWSVLLDLLFLAISSLLAPTLQEDHVTTTR
jgi:glycosyltransferase 2 family protein